MATYTYRCNNKKCNEVFEMKQSIHDDKLVTCPHCNKDELEKIITASPLLFKGRGWTGKLRR